jgi:carboxypeptidase family protein
MNGDVMTNKRFALAFVVLASVAARPVAAQQPPRPADMPRAVTLSLAEYNRLVDLASRQPQPAPAPPVPAVLTSADLRVRIERDTARGVFTLTGDVLRAGVSRIHLISGATLVDASAGGRPLPLIVDGNAHNALLPGPGPFALTLEWGAPVRFAPGRASFVLPVPPSGTAKATFDLPGDQADVHLSHGLITARTVNAGRTILEATLTPAQQTEVSWSMRDSAPIAAAREARTLADVFSLVTIGDSDLRMVALVDLTVVQGEPRTFDLRLPAGYEVTSLSGSTLDSSEPRDGHVILTVADAAARRHQFLISLERQHEGGSFSTDTAFVTLADVQRERGEIAIEGVGTLELSAAETDGLHRIDVRELNRALQTLARLPVLSAFRYQRAAGAAPHLALDVKRFADTGVLAAVADRAVATTLVTMEGRALTEVSLRVQNRAQPFLKVTLPAGASIVSVTVAGESAKPVLGADGTRVPLLRSGFHPAGPYDVSFVYLHAGTPFARKGDLQMTLPKMDLPVGIVEWEVFVPDVYSVRVVDGNVIDRQLIERAADASRAHLDPASGVTNGVGGGLGRGVSAGYAGGVAGSVNLRTPAGMYRSDVAGPSGQIRGRAVDSIGGALAGATVVLDAGGKRQTVTTGADGTFTLANVASGPVTVVAQAAGFAQQAQTFTFDENKPQEIAVAMAIGSPMEAVTVTAQSPTIQASTAKQADKERAAEPSANVVNLQRRAAGVLPVRVDVPRAGTSHQFVKPLLVDEEATVAFRYKRR